MLLPRYSCFQQTNQARLQTKWQPTCLSPSCVTPSSVCRSFATLHAKHTYSDGKRVTRKPMVCRLIPHHCANALEQSTAAVLRLVRLGLLLVHRPCCALSVYKMRYSCRSIFTHSDQKDFWKTAWHPLTSRRLASNISSSSTARATAGTSMDSWTSSLTGDQIQSSYA